MGDRLAVAIGPEPGMEIDHSHVAAATQIALDDRMQRAVGPGSAASAIEHAIGIDELAARHGAEEGNVAYFLAISRELGVGRRDPARAEVGGNEKLGDLEITLVDRIRLRVID